MLPTIKNNLINNLVCLPNYLLRPTRLTSSLALDGGYSALIGLEIHAQINATSKLFSRSTKEYLSAPNTNVSLFDCSIPGTLPIINRYCVESTVRSGLALNCSINEKCLFDRKHYFYPDSPSGFQITQKREPIAYDGLIKFIIPKTKAKEAEIKKVGLKAIQLEQDTGKSLKDIKTGVNYIDLNRCGVGLMEFVFEPELSNQYEAFLMVKELIQILKRIDTCSCKMEEGALRIDANVSVSPIDGPSGNRIELKNLNSLQSLAKGLEYEIARHVKVLKDGFLVPSETRFYDPIRKKTFPMRDKDNVEDYRYMPEPNLPPLRLSEEKSELEDDQIVSIVKLKETMPSLPEKELDDLINRFGVILEHAGLIVENNLYQFFCQLMEINPKFEINKLSKFVANDLAAILKDANITLEESNISPHFIIDCFELNDKGVITMLVTQDVINLALLGDNRSPKEIIKEHGWQMIRNEQLIKEACLKVMEEYAIAVYSAKRNNSYSLELLIDLIVKQLNSQITRNNVRLQLKIILDSRDSKTLKKAAIAAEKRAKEGEEVLDFLTKKEKTS